MIFLYPPPALNGLYEYFISGLKLADNFYQKLSGQLKNILNDLNYEELFTTKSLSPSLVILLKRGLKTFQESVLPYGTYEMEEDKYHCNRAIVITSVFSPLLHSKNVVDEQLVRFASGSGKQIQAYVNDINEQELCRTVHNDFYAPYEVVKNLSKTAFRFR